MKLVKKPVAFLLLLELELETRLPVYIPCKVCIISGEGILSSAYLKMVYGKVVAKLAQIYENDEGGIVGGGSEPVDERTECPKSKPNSNIML